MSNFVFGAPELPDHHKILLLLINGYSEKLDKPTTALFHEYLLLLLAKENIGFTSMFNLYKFKSYSKGIFSEQLRDDLQILFSNKLINYKAGKLIVTGLGKNILHSIYQESKFKELIEKYKKPCNKYNSPYSIYDATSSYSSNGKIGEELRLSL